MDLLSSLRSRLTRLKSGMQSAAEAPDHLSGDSQMLGHDLAGVPISGVAGAPMAATTAQFVAGLPQQLQQLVAAHAQSLEQQVRQFASFVFLALSCTISGRRPSSCQLSGTPRGYSAER